LTVPGGDEDESAWAEVGIYRPKGRERVLHVLNGIEHHDSVIEGVEGLHRLEVAT
jgi:hypothetical protein